MQEFMTFKSGMKKVRKFAGRKEFSEAQRKNEDVEGVLNFSEVIKERYPRFIDAIRDLPDCIRYHKTFMNLFKM